MPNRVVAVLLTLAAVLAPGFVVDSAHAAASKPVLAVHPATVVQQDPITLSGRTTQRRVIVYRRLYGHAWTRIGTARTTHGHFTYRTRPVAGRTNLYRTSAAGKARTSRVAKARSVGCTPLLAHGDVATWTQDTTVINTLTRNWAQLICSAAPNSTITMAEMYAYENSATVARLMNALRAVHAYRGVRVRVLVQRGGYYPGAQWAALKRHFRFAEVHYCTYGCHSSDPNAHAHTKFMVLSKTIFGGSAVLESSANWSGEQFDRQRQSGVYVYGNNRLTQAYLQEWASLTTRSLLDATTWRSAGSGISYSFDPRPAATDPIASELHTLTCEPGDSIGVADTLLSRPTLVAELTRLAQAGCQVQVLIDPSGSVVTALSASTRAVVEHDKFVVIDAHAAGTGAARQEVIHGSENYSTGSMTLSDQQLLLLRRPDVYATYLWWFGYLWKRSVALPPTPTAPPPTTTPPTTPPPTTTPPTTAPPPEPDSVRTTAGASRLVGASTCSQPAASADDDSTSGTCAQG
ncbi:phosphatidylserine/phosphatidylglycerophosphate/cardiolipin synthase family protein [uncultured Jatrophihabitans sp.]|uniref:phospholipase D-like domain-containing protein n=1 Tax=uncultured Jatrophihabitans sp. TaxID=1610747 RepID=UPI0035CA88A4